MTPFEFELACVRGKEWTGEYETDIARVLPRLRQDLADAAEDAGNTGEDDDAEPVFSLLRGGNYVTHSVAASAADDGELSTAGATLALRGSLAVVASKPAAQYLAARSFAGLEVNAGDRPAALAVDGRSGLAAGYTHEAPAEA